MSRLQPKTINSIKERLQAELKGVDEEDGSVRRHLTPKSIERLETGEEFRIEFANRNMKFTHASCYEKRAVKKFSKTNELDCNCLRNLQLFFCETTAINGLISRQPFSS